MISITDAVVHKGAVMIEFLHTNLAHGAVEGAPRLDDLAIKTEVVQVNALIIGDP